MVDAFAILIPISRDARPNLFEGAPDDSIQGLTERWRGQADEGRSPVLAGRAVLPVPALEVTVRY